MQEAIELVKKYDNREIPFNVMLFNLELLLKKEKEHIIDAFESSRNIQDSDDISITYDWVNASEYYNQTYNKTNM